MYSDIPDPYSPPTPKGVYRPNANFPGLVRVEVVDSSGDLMAVLECRAEVHTEAFEKAFRRLLQEKDTGVKLRLVLP